MISIEKLERDVRKLEQRVKSLEDRNKKLGEILILMKKKLDGSGLSAEQAHFIEMHTPIG